MNNGHGQLNDRLRSLMISSDDEMNKVFPTNSDFIIPISVQPNYMIGLRYFKHMNSSYIK